MLSGAALFLRLFVWQAARIARARLTGPGGGTTGTFLYVPRPRARAYQIFAGLIHCALSDVNSNHCVSTISASIGGALWLMSPEGQARTRGISGHPH